MNQALPGESMVVSRLRKGASDNECQMGRRKVKRGNTVYEMQPRAQTGQKSDRRAENEFASLPGEFATVGKLVWRRKHNWA
jgi:hypothetical protein